MIGDYFTKPVWDSLFFNFQNQIPGITEDEYENYKIVYYEAKARNAATSESNNG